MLRLGLAALLLVVSLVAAPAQQAQRVAGTIQGINGDTLVVKTRDGEAKVVLAANTAVFGVVNATLADIKPGAFIGVGAMPQSDGSQRAIQVIIFAENQRGTGEGHRPWIQPGSTMTNATVETTVGSVNGQVLMVKYAGGEQKIIVPPEARIRAYVVGDRSELKPGAAILITQARPRADGMLETSRINVGRGDVVP